MLVGAGVGFALIAFGIDGPNCAAQVVDGKFVLAGAPLDPMASPFSSFFFFFDFFFLDFLVPVVAALLLSFVADEFSDVFLKIR